MIWKTVISVWTSENSFPKNINMEFLNIIFSIFAMAFIFPHHWNYYKLTHFHELSLMSNVFHELLIYFYLKDILLQYFTEIQKNQITSPLRKNYAKHFHHAAFYFWGFIWIAWFAQVLHTQHYLSVWIGYLMLFRNHKRIHWK